MYDFKKVLNEGEEIIYTGMPNLGKGSKDIKLIVTLLVNTFLVLFLIFGTRGFVPKQVCYMVIFFSLVPLYIFVYNTILKDMEIKHECYCITNKRVLIYNKKKDKLVSGNIINFDYSIVGSLKGDYGDICFQIRSLNKRRELSKNKEVIYMRFAKLYKPEMVLGLFKNARNNI